MVKARNENQDCAMCCNPNPTQVYKHLPGFVKLLCSISTALGSTLTTTGTGALVKSTSPTLVSPTLGNAIASSVTLTKANVTQGTSTATTVVANGSAGVITTFAQTLASDTSVSFTVTNSSVTASSVIQLTMNDNGSAGNAIVKVNTIAAGSFVVKIYNAHPTVALNSAVKVNFLVV